MALTRAFLWCPMGMIDYRSRRNGAERMLQFCGHTRLLLCLITLCIGWAIVSSATMRTSRFGFSWTHFCLQTGAATVLIGPIAVIIFRGSRWWRLVVGSLLLVLLSAGASELFSWGQERLVLARMGRAPAVGVHVWRWFPFHGDGIIYTPGKGWGAHD